MRELARLLIEAQKVLASPSLGIKDLIRPDRFDGVVEATKRASGFDAEKDHLQWYTSPSTALKIGYAIKKAAYIVEGKVLRDRDGVTSTTI